MMRRLMIHRLTAAALLVLLSGCGTVKDYFAGTDNTTPPAPLPSLTTTLNVQTVWSARAGVGSAKEYIKLTPSVSSDTIFAADSAGLVSAYQADTGKIVWSVQTKAPISGGTGSGEGLVLVGTRDAEVLALDVASGAEKWRAQVSSEVLSVPRAESGIIVVRTVDGKLFGLKAGDGSRLWVYQSSTPALTLRGTSSPLLHEGKVIAGLANGKLAALSLTDGKLLWETTVAEPRGRSELERLVDISGELQIQNDILYAASFQGRLAAVDTNSGRLVWVREIHSQAGLAVDERAVYVTDNQSQVLALDRRDGGILWKQDKLHDRAVTAPAVYGDYVVVGDFEGHLHWLNRTDGAFAARVRVDDAGLLAAPVTMDDTLYALGKGGALTALRAER